MSTGSRGTSPGSRRRCRPERAGAVTGGAIRLHQLVKTFDGYPAVAGIDLELDQGAAFAQQLDLVDPAFTRALQLDLHDTPRIVALDPLEDRP